MRLDVDETCDAAAAMRSGKGRQVSRVTVRSLRWFIAAVCAAGILVAGCAPLPGQNTGTYIPQRSGFDSSGCVASACGDSGN